MKKPVTNWGASIREKLMNEFRTTGVNFDRILRRYAYERLLKRLELAGDAERFVLKGAMLFVLWDGETFRPTRDLDLLGLGMFSEEGAREIFVRATQMQTTDGLEFESEVSVAPIREDQKYGGLRVRLRATLGQARIPLQVDIGLGDAVFPAPIRTEIPCLAGQARPKFLVYPKEAVIAEKLHALTDRGLLNSRLKDYHDMWVLAKTNDFEGGVLSQAIFSTFRRRATVPLSVDLSGLTPEFAEQNRKPWSVWLDETRSTRVDLDVVVNDLTNFLVPVLKGLIETGSFEAAWDRVAWRWRG
jgi:predicted nucleotidyltransferase component of viral defense system